MDTDVNVAGRKSYEPSAVARILVSTGEKLIELLNAESALLRASKTREIATLGTDKTRLSQIFAAGWQEFQAAPETLEQLAPELGNELRLTAVRLDSAAVENEMMLRTGRRTTELVIAAVGRALEAQRPKPTYTAQRMASSLPRGHTGIGFSRSA